MQAMVAAVADLSSLAYAAFEATGFATMVRRSRASGLVLCYHNVVACESDAADGDTSLHMDVERFRRQMDWLVRHYDVVPLREVARRLEHRRSLRGMAAVTFDDGYAAMCENASPVLRELGIPATVFVVAGAPGRADGFWWDQAAVRAAGGKAQQREYWLRSLRGDGDAILRDLRAAGPKDVPAQCRPADWDTLRRLNASGCELGVHSATHRALPHVDPSEWTREIEASREVIAAETGVTPELFSYPYGLWTEPLRRRVERAGYAAAVGLGQRLVGPDADRWALPRVNIPAGIPEPAFRAWTAGLAWRRGALS